MAVNTQTTLDYRFCSTNKFYDPSRGQRCIDVEPKNEKKKKDHLRFNKSWTFKINLYKCIAKIFC